MIFEGSSVVYVCYPTLKTCACLPFPWQMRMDDHYELEGAKVLHERKLTSIDWQYILSHRFLTFS